MFQQSLGQLRSAVATYANLPLSGNNKGDIRITLDLGAAYTWISESGSGTWVDWKKVTVSNYNDLNNRPISSPLAIDTATQTVRNIYLNYVYMFFMSMVSISINVMKMFDGVLDALHTEDGIDLTRTSGQRRVLAPTMQSYAGFYFNDFDGSLDSYTKLLIHGYQLNGEATDFFDSLLNDILRNDTITSATNTKFGNKALSFDASLTSYLLLNSFYNTPTLGLSNDGNPFKVNGVDFTWDFWVRCNADAAETIMVDHQFNHDDGTNFKIEKTAAKKIKVSLRGCTDYTWDNQNVPTDPISYDVTGTTSIEKEVWYHIGIVRQSGYIKLYINGILDGTSSVADTQNIIDYDNELVIGNENGLYLGKGFNGRIEEVRFSKGIARYTSTFTPRTTAYNEPTDNPIGVIPFTHYKLNEDAANAAVADSGTGTNNGTASRNTNLLSQTGKIAKAFNFTRANNDQIQVNDFVVDIKNDTTGTFSYWFKPSALGDSGYLFCASADATHPVVNSSYDGAGNIVSFMIYQDPNDGAWQWQSANNITEESWYHLVVVQDGVSPKIYINGVDVTSTGNFTTANDITAWMNKKGNAVTAKIGGCVCANIWFDGLIDDFRYYKNTALTSDQVAILYNEGNGIEEESITTDNMIIQSEGYETNTIPSSARVVIFEQDGIASYDPKVVQAVTPNTDIKLYVSRDAGTTFTQVTDLKVEMDINQEVIWTSLYSNVNFLVGTVDLSTQPNGKEIVYKITTHNNKDLLIRAIAINWK